MNIFLVNKANLMKERKMKIFALKEIKIIMYIIQEILDENDKNL